MTVRRCVCPVRRGTLSGIGNSLLQSARTKKGTGGGHRRGLPLREENRRLLRSSGTVVFLNRDPAEIFATADMSGRPLGQQGKEAFLERFAQRLPLYRACAHVEITNFRSVRQTVTEILMKLEGYI